MLQSVVPISDDEVVLGQYEGYRDDSTVPNDSKTPTFATTILRIHNERWEGTMSHFTLNLFIYQSTLENQLEIDINVRGKKRFDGSI